MGGVRTPAQRTATVAVDYIASFFFLASAPLRLLWPVSAVVGGVWLGVLGDWAAVGAGFMAALAAPFLLNWLLFTIRDPVVSLVANAEHTEDRTLLWLGLILSQLLTYAVVSAWLCTVFWYFLLSPAQGAFWPRAMWSYALAMGPWEYLMARDRDDGGVMTANFTNSTAAVACTGAGLWFVLANGSTTTAVAAIFCATMLAGLAIQTLAAGLSYRR